MVHGGALATASTVSGRHQQVGKMAAAQIEIAWPRFARSRPPEQAHCHQQAPAVS
jgi:hypothetical protein